MAELEERFNSWKRVFESKGLKENMRKTKVMECGPDGGVVEMARINGCGVCGKRVMRNSVMCGSCERWVHARCAGVRRVTARMAKGFECKRCGRRQEPEQHQRLPDLERVDSFAYLGDAINNSEGSELTVTRRTRLAWLRFRELLSALHGRRLSLVLRGRIYSTSV